jgi:hypothetical protein
MRSRSDFDRADWERWLATLPVETAEELRAGMDLADWFDDEYQKLEERKDVGKTERTV